MARQLADENCWQLLLAASKVGFRDRARGGQRRAGARGSVRVPTRAVVQQLLSRISRCCRKANAEKKTFLLWMTEYFRAQLERTLAVLGIEVPEYM